MTSAAVRSLTSSWSRRRRKSSGAAGACRSHSIRFRRRSFSAVVLGREPPLAEWFSNLDASVGHSPGLFAGEPESDLAALIADPHARGIRIIVLEGADVNWPGLDLPPVANRSPSAQVDEALDSQASLAPPQPAFLLHDGPVRPGQSVTFPEGDVTDLGSIASGAEVIAGGSIQIYGPLRGRAIAGSTGYPRTRVFCQSLEVELLGINGLRRTADDVAPQPRG